jgi:Flp pilus assembly protein CpaB
MKKKQIIGIVLIVAGIGALSYLYNGYYLAYQDAMKSKKQKPQETTTKK